MSSQAVALLSAIRARDAEKLALRFKSLAWWDSVIASYADRLIQKGVK